tara:strand:- start:371 stop:589 length:219 start_codon:yes stop_codon:yes gene_type:complete
MIKFLVFFVLGAATLYFIIRTFVNSEPGRVGRFLKIIFIAAIVFGIIYFLFRGNLGFLAPLLGLARRLLVGF